MPPPGGPGPQRQQKATARPDPARHSQAVVNTQGQRARANSHSTRYSLTFIQRPDPIRRGSERPTASPVQMDPQSQQMAGPQGPQGPQDPKPISRTINIAGPTQEVKAGPEDVVPGVKRVDSNLNKHDAKELDSLKRENVRLKEQIDQLKSAMFQHVAAVPNHLESLTIAQNENQNLAKQLSEWRQRAEMARITSEKYQMENEKLRGEAANAIQSMATENSKNDEKIRLLVDKVTKDKVQGRWNPLPDDDIRHKLHQLNADMRDWSKVWAAKSLNFEKGVNKEIQEFFRNFVRLDPDQRLPPLLRKPPPKMKDKLGQVLLHAALADQVHEDFFRFPFFCTEKSQARSLHELFQNMKDVDRKGADIWRAGLWRLLNPPVPDDGSNVPPILEMTNTNVKAYCERVMRTIHKGPASILMSQLAENSADAQNRASRLRNILLTAAGIAMNLWTQHSSFDNLDLGGIHDRNKLFTVTDPLLQPHPLSKVDLDNDENNNRGIVLCARPALVAYDVDDTSGIDGDSYRVLAPAIVLLDGSF